MTTSAPEHPPSGVDPKLLEILVCPLTKGPLEYDAEKQELISRSAKLAYPIRAGIPIMLPEEARRLDGPCVPRRMHRPLIYDPLSCHRPRSLSPRKRGADDPVITGRSERHRFSLASYLHRLLDARSPLSRGQASRA